MYTNNNKVITVPYKNTLYMEKIIAVLTQKGALSKGFQENTIIRLFSLNNNKVQKVENIKLEKTDNNSISLWMTTKKVTILYAETISADLKKMLQVMGIKIKCKEEFENDCFIEQFIFE